MRTLWMVGVVLGLCACPRGGSSSSSSGGGNGFDASITFDAGDIPDAARDQDVVPPDSGPACGTVSPDGECSGDTLRYCEVHTLRESDCAARGRVCQLQPTLGGYWCVGVFGSACELNQVDVCPEGVACVQHVCGGPMDGGVITDGGLQDGGGASSSSSAMGGSSTSGPASSSASVEPASSSASGLSSSGSSGTSVSG